MRNQLLIIGGSFLLAFLPASSLVVLAQYHEQEYVARHLKEDREWARKSGLPVVDIRKLRLLADAPDGSNTLIDSLDTKSLRSRNQILLVTTDGNGHCLGLYVFEHRGQDHRLIWSATEMFSGAGYCRESPYNPEAYVRAGRIIVKIPVFDYQRGVPRAAELYSYVWAGKSYRYAGSRSDKIRR